MSKPNANVMKRLAMALETCGTSLSEAAVQMVGEILAYYEPEAVIKALDRCMREVKGRLTPAEIIERIDDGRPTAEEAWAMVGHDDEGRTIVTTREAMEAMGTCRELFRDDPVAARMAFKDAYRREVQEGRAAKRPAVWMVSAGTDRAGYERAVYEALDKGRLSEDAAAKYLGTTAGNLRLGQGAQRPVISGRAAAMVAGLVKRLDDDGGERSPDGTPVPWSEVDR